MMSLWSYADSGRPAGLEDHLDFLRFSRSSRARAGQVLPQPLPLAVGAGTRTDDGARKGGFTTTGLADHRPASHASFEADGSTPSTAFGAGAGAAGQSLLIWKWTFSAVSLPATVSCLWHALWFDDCSLVHGAPVSTQ